MDGDVAGHCKPLPLRCAHHLDAFGRRQPADVHLHAGAASEREDRRQRDGLRGRRNRWQAEARRNFTFMRDAAPAEIRILRPQPYAVAERRRVLHRTKEHAGVDERRLGLREGDTAGLGELAHLGELDALERTRQRSNRIDVRLVERPRAVLQHLHEPRHVERRIGVGRARKARHAAGDRRLHFGLQRRLVLEARLAQARRQIDEPGAHDQSCRIDHAVGPPSGRRGAERRDLPVGDIQRADAVEPVPGIDDAALLNLDLHQDAL